MRERLPDTVEERVDILLTANLAPQQERLMRYLLKHPKAYTHELARNCAVGYPPNRLGELNKLVLPRYGLQLVCTPPPKELLNRFGQKTFVHQWKIVLLPTPAKNMGGA